MTSKSTRQRTIIGPVCARSYGERMKRSRHVKRRCSIHWTDAQRLAYYSKVDPLSGCHIWQGALRAEGYGNLTVRNQNWLAHRLAWTLKHGPIPDGMILCRRCDERRCCNPDHLFLGTRGDNMADLKKKREIRADARANGSGTIRIIYRGVELVGEVRVVAVDPRVRE